MVDDLTTERHHYQYLRDWAKGIHPLEAATELLIRSGWARLGQPWLRLLDADGDTDSGGEGGAGYWIDFDSIPDHIGGLSGGQRRLLAIATALGSSSEASAVNLNDALPGLDRNTVDLVLAAVSHAAGTHQGVTETFDDDDRPVFSAPPGVLDSWPKTDG